MNKHLRLSVSDSVAFLEISFDAPLSRSFLFPLPKYVGDYAHMGPKCLPIALLSAGACITATQSVLENRIDSCYVLCRPPGHHATPSKGMGFCVFNNVAVAVRYLRHVVEQSATATANDKNNDNDTRKIRVAIIDLDVHHGNGTQDVFYDDPNTLFISVHQAGLYPRESGYVAESGGAGALGANVNVPLPAGSGDGAYRYVAEQVIVPALQMFTPDVVYFSMGYDASAYDPLGRMMISSVGFGDCVSIILNACKDMQTRLPIIDTSLPTSFSTSSSSSSSSCASSTTASSATRSRFPVILCHEGGYSPIQVPYAAAVVIDRLIAYSHGNLPPLPPSVRPEDVKDTALDSAIRYTPYPDDPRAYDQETPLIRSANDRDMCIKGGKVHPNASWPFQYLGLHDPFHAELSSMTGNGVQPVQARVVDYVRRVVVEGELAALVRKRQG